MLGRLKTLESGANDPCESTVRVRESVISSPVVFSCSEINKVPLRTAKISRVALLPCMVTVHSRDHWFSDGFCHAVHCETLTVLLLLPRSPAKSTKKSPDKAAFPQVVGSVDAISHSLVTVGVLVTHE